MNQKYQGKGNESIRKPPNFEERFDDALYLTWFAKSSIIASLQAIFGDSQELVYATAEASRLGYRLK